MINCPQCHHENPEGALQCEACFAPLSLSTSEPEPAATSQMPDNRDSLTVEGETPPVVTQATADEASVNPTADHKPIAWNPTQQEAAGVVSSPSTPSPEMVDEMIASSPLPNPPLPQSPSTQIQLQCARLLHVQSNTTIDLPADLSTIHIGKPNDQVPPDIDISGLPDTEIVSRLHADIRVEADRYYIEDLGSTNGTYINHTPLLVGNRHRLRSGDRIALGKEDKVTFIFQVS